MIKLTQRVKDLREASRTKVVTVDPERADIITSFYKQNLGKYSIPVMRAMAFKELCEKRTIYIGETELIVGERGRAPGAVPSFPEIICHTARDFEELNKRTQASYKSDKTTIDLYENEIAPFWKGRSFFNKVFSQLNDLWHECHEAGIFTASKEQRAPGEASIDETFFRVGIKDAQNRIADCLNKIDYLNDADALEKAEELKAMNITCEAIILYANRCSERAKDEVP